jgi:predicted RNA-binding Zn-ribbon protein involved in translation (DUF1610 family)
MLNEPNLDIWQDGDWHVFVMCACGKAEITCMGDEWAWKEKYGKLVCPKCGVSRSTWKRTIARWNISKIVPRLFRKSIGAGYWEVKND